MRPIGDAGGAMAIASADGSVTPIAMTTMGTTAPTMVTDRASASGSEAAAITSMVIIADRQLRGELDPRVENAAAILQPPGN